MNHPFPANPHRAALLTLAVAMTWVLSSAPPAKAQTSKRALEIADLYRVANVGDPQLSPDGETAVFAVGKTDFEKGERWSHLWSLDLGSGETRQLTYVKKNDGHPRYSPDGKNLLFVSDRDETSQVWVMAVAGGEARELTKFPAGLADAEWAGDGKHIVAVSDVYPECGADGDCHKRIRDAIDEGPLNVHVAESLLYRHWTSWKDGTATHLMLIDAATGEVLRDLTPGPFDAPTFSTGGRGFALSPDGNELCYVSNHDADQAGSTNTDLWLMPLTGKGMERNITVANPGHDSGPLYSPDGRYIAWLAQSTPGYESDLTRLVLYDRESGETRSLTDGGNFDNWVEDFRWAPDSRSILFKGSVPGRNALFRYDLASQKITELYREHHVEGFESTPDGKSIVFSERAIDRPLEMYRVDSDGTGLRRLTEFNRELEEELDLRSPEEIWVDVGGYKVHTLVIKPHGFAPEKKYPLIVNVHGGPQGQWSDNWRGDWQVYPAKGYVVALPNPTGSSGYGQAFTDAIRGDWGGRVYEDLMKVTDHLAALPYVDAERMGVMGWSFGGYMVMWMEGHTDRFKAAAAMMGLYDLPMFYGATEELWFPERDLHGAPWTSEHYETWSPSNFVENFRTPCLVITGELDYRVPYTQSLAFFTALQRKQVPSRLVVYPDAGHWPSWYEMAFYYNEHLAWFAKYLGGGAAPYDRVAFARNQLFEEAE